MENLWRDVRYGARMLSRNKGMTAIAIVTLALGIGANSALFGIINAVLLRPLPVRDPARVAVIVMDSARLNAKGAQAGFSVYASWKRHTRLLDSIAAAAPGTAALDLAISSEPVKLWRVSSSFFATFGIAPALGRSFTEAEDQPGASRVAIISDRLWRSAFAADPRVLGTTLKADNTTYTIIGVLPHGFHVDGRPADIYTPIARSSEAKDWLGVDVYARLRPRVTVQQAEAEVQGISAEQLRQGPAGWTPRVFPIRDFQVREVRLSLLVLLGAVGLVLLIACANTASLLLARAHARSQEIAIREALGAARRTLLRQLLTESTLLALIGGVAGILVAALCTRVIPLIQHERLPGLLEQTRVDTTVLLFSLALSIATGLLFGAVPAMTMLRPHPYETIKTGGRAGAGRMRHRAFRALVVSEAALAIVLAIGATLLIRTFFYLRDVAPGFRVDGLVIVTINSERGKFASKDQCIAYYRDMAEAIRRVPGVKSASYATNLPLMGELGAMTTAIEGHQWNRAEDVPVLWVRSVDPAYFTTMGVPLRRGRLFSDSDHQTAPRVIIVNEAFVRRFWQGQNPIGKHIGNGPERAEVIGVSGDVRSQDSTKDAAAEVFYPYLQQPTARVTLAIRPDPAVYRRPLLIEPAIRKAVGDVDQTQAIQRVAEVQQVISDRVAPKRLSAQIIAIFAFLAVALAVVGVYGVLSFTVAQRTQEIGVRMALGAERSALVRMVVGSATRLAGGGAVVGIAAALGFTRVLKTLLYGVSPTDPWTYAAAAAGTLMIAVAAALVPAYHATRVDPIVALREE